VSYGFNALITIDHTKVAATQSDFPVLIKGTYDGTDGEPDFRTVANGGHVQNTASGSVSDALTVPADFVFADNDDGSSPWDFEMQDYDASTGDIIAWAEAPTLSALSDTEVYAAYGDDAIESSQEDVNGTWEASFEAVWHLAEASGDLLDSTSNGYDLTAYNTPTYGAAGRIGSCIQFDKGSSEYAEIDTPVVTGEPMTFSAWGYCTNDDNSVQSFIFVGDKDNYGQFWQLSLNTVTNTIGWVPRDGFTYGTSDSANTWPGQDNWVYAVGKSASDTDHAALINAGGKGTNATEVTISGADRTSVGRAGDSSPDGYFAGLIDEARIASAARDDDYITTDYNCQSDPASFYSTGPEQAAAGGATYTLTADAGSLELAGQDAGLTAARVLTADAGAFELTGYDAGLYRGYTLAADAGSAELTGQDASLLVSRQLTADTGSLELTGHDAGLIASRLLSADTGALELTGHDASLLVSRLLSAEAGTLAFTGRDATLTYTPIGGPTYTLTADAGTFTLTGQDAGLIVSRLLSAEAGAVVLTGHDAEIVHGYVLAAEAGSLELTGNDAALVLGRVLQAGAGSLELTGYDVTFLYSGAPAVVTPDSRIFVIAAEDRVYIIAAEDRTYVINA